MKFETKLLLDLIILLCSEPAAAVVIDSDPIGEHMENEPAEINVVITFYCFSLSIHTLPLAREQEYLWQYLKL